jgi:hypothetical protein
MRSAQHAAREAGRLGRGHDNQAGGVPGRTARMRSVVH